MQNVLKDISIFSILIGHSQCENLILSRLRGDMKNNSCEKWGSVLGFYWKITQFFLISFTTKFIYGSSDFIKIFLAKNVVRNTVWYFSLFCSILIITQKAYVKLANSFHQTGRLVADNPVLIFSRNAIKSNCLEIEFIVQFLSPGNLHYA